MVTTNSSVEKYEGIFIDKKLEDDFTAEYLADNVIQHRFYILIGIFLFLVFHLLDRYLLEIKECDISWECLLHRSCELCTMLLIRLTVATLCLVVFFLSFTKFYLNRGFALVTTALLICSFGVNALMYTAFTNTPEYYTGLIIIMIFGTVLFRLKFKQILLLCLTSILVFSIICLVLFKEELILHTFISQLTFLFTVGTICCIGALHYARNARNLWLLNKKHRQSTPSNARHKQYDIFISYSRSNKGIAEELEQKLDATNLCVFRDQSELVIGKEWHKSLMQSIRNSKMIVFIASQKSLESTDAILELGHAFILDKKICTLLIHGLSNSDLPLQLQALYHVEYDTEAQKNKAVNQIKEEVLRLTTSD
ncbi:toll/interleukin-1 receptor domain-containing protein [Portibacter marinus]|uniref:toll/interleukin-1 receptor domain-containing protein n=1 Tax=Portibacter marinus TaxID=2898660 RepID=UPI001F46D132|nr:toll/interleukin-1 receptor domain-containing protein [Portibacter marinus]